MVQSKNYIELIEGYHRFREGHCEEKAEYRALAQGQNPKILYISCCDSRVEPSLILTCKPGDLFTVRNVANLVPPCNVDPRHHGTSAALEFAVTILDVTDIVICGHSQCGGIQALMCDSTKQTNDFIDTWMNIAKPAKETILAKHHDCTFEEQLMHCEKESVLVSINNLKTFPWIKKRLDRGEIFLHAWHFDIGSALLQEYSENKWQKL